MAKRHKTLSILVIPEGEKQTFSIKMRYGVLKALLGLFVLFCIILTAGAISYWHLTKLSIDYERLSSTNKKLLRDNAIVNEITEKFKSMQEIDKRIRSIFGDIDFPDDEPSSTLSRFSADGKYVTPMDRESLYGSLNPFLRADILGSYPTLIPVEGKITQYYSPKDAVTGIGHFGIDLAAKEGSVVNAAGDGIVVFANWTVESGNQIIIDHQNGYLSIYKHNASLIVQGRSYVYKGEPIALLGSSGVSSAPHLHFEIWKNYIPVDPLTLWSVN